MFYSQFILAKKGPLGTIWIAAHLERKLRKNQVADTDIGVSVDSIIFPEVPIALRLSSHLLLGVVRIYSRKVNYLFDDCSEALLKIKQAFRSTAVDLPPEESTAPYHSITLPETFDLDDFELPDNEIFHGNYVDHHVSAKEQITLQDTMEGVVYSTSQFGLDERFGDGETCQIGLDLNEDTSFEKTAAPVEAFDADPQASLQPMTPFDADDNNVGITESSKAILENRSRLQAGVLERNSEFTDYAEAPSTPMLVEEANLLSVQEALVSDEHVESEVPSLPEPFAVDRGRSISQLDTVGGHLFGEMTMKQDEIQYTSDGTEHVSVDNGNSVPLSSLNHSEMENTVSLSSRSRNGVMDNLDSAGCINEVVSIEEPSSCAAGKTDAKSAELLPAKPDESFEQANRNPPEVAGTVENAFSLEKTPADFQLESLESHGCNNKELKIHDDLLKGQDNEMQSKFMHGLQACNSSINHQEGTSVLEGEKDFHTADSVELDFDENQTLQPTVREKEQTSGWQLVEKGTIMNDLQNDNCHMNLDLPAPEKLLSVSNEVADKPNILLMESTPNKEYLLEDMLHVSGKKDSLTEMAVPMQGNSAESFGLSQSEQTIGPIPDDDDLLSSILVGRRSSVLKMRPSPVPLALTPAKRVRTASRTSAPKRKVLMDEAMVLHGDVIRQQLMSTEDLRRARKKAPCTLSEISTLRRQFLEDEIFSESTFTGLSTGLSYMQKGAYDLSRLKICEFDKAIAPVTAAKEMIVKSNLSGETEKEGNESSQPVRDGPEVKADEILHHEKHPDDLLASGCHTIEFEVHTLPESFDRVDPMEIDEGMVEGVEALSQSAVFGLDALVAVDSMSEDTRTMSVNFAVDSNLTEKENDVIELHTSSGNAFNAQGLENNPSMVEPITEKGLDAHTEPIVNTSVAEVEPQAGDHSFPKELNGDASNDIKTNSAFDHCLVTDQDVATSAVTALAVGDEHNNVAAVESGEAAEKYSISTVHEVEGQTGQLGHEVEETADIQSCTEPRADNVNPLGHEGDLTCSSLITEETLDIPDPHGRADFWTTNDLDDLENVMMGNDTEFLNVDDDEVDEDNEHVPDGEETQLLDNSGWSSRTRAVAKYLQTLFDKEAVHGRSLLAMDSLLAGKTRKEASRMFFESLVLKTKDYIHVEQGMPFESITMRPRGKLMKSVF